MPNYNEKTGIAFGVVYGNEVPYLEEEIFTHGTNLVYQEVAEDIKWEFRSAWSDLAYEKIPSQELREELERIYNYYCNMPHNGDILEADIDTLVDECLENFETDNVSYEYDDGKSKYYMTTLGGAIIIYVCESPWVCYARPCSPCVPGAGDLSNIRSDYDSNVTLCYCFDPEDYLPHEEDRPPFVISSDYDVRGIQYTLVQEMVENER